MSLNTFILLTSAMVVVLLVPFKWKKSLTSVILLEAVSTIVLVLLFTSNSVNQLFVLIMLPFFVSEALVILTALFVSIRSSSPPLSAINLT
uniref:NADH dehydrogenase subunit 4L n=1 Tax=Paralongidorus litoralis TaxID=474435 RepID=A0A1P8C768_9BILA|nr:NADH dehydrogenase subunit 4L [Paralongidorus litoralis]AOT84243.1 NADH dehydrogenase subunit 4L [Paralongidorus litoralis]